MGKTARGKECCQFSFLQGCIKALGLTHGEFAQKVKIPHSTFSTKLRGKSLFDIEEMYRIMDAIGQPDTMIDVVFPPLVSFHAKQPVRSNKAVSISLSGVADNGQVLEGMNPHKKGGVKAAASSNTPLRVAMVPLHEWEVLKKYLGGYEEDIVFMPAQTMSSSEKETNIEAIRVKIAPAPMATIHTA